MDRRGDTQLPGGAVPAAQNSGNSATVVMFTRSVPATQEDRIVCEHVRKTGPRKWSKIAGNLPGRIGKQCRERSLPPLDHLAEPAGPTAAANRLSPAATPSHACPKACHAHGSRLRDLAVRGRH